MKKKVLFFLVFLLMICSFLILESCSIKENKISNQEFNNDNMIVIYKSNKKIEVPPDSPNYHELKNEIESIAVRADSSYKLIIEKRTIDKLRSRGFAVEMYYALPYEVEVDYLSLYLNKDKITIKSILVPLTNEYFPGDIVLLFTSQDDFYTVANTNYKKENLAKLIEDF